MPIRSLAILAAISLLTPAAHAQLRLGAIGDSLTDEYSDETFNYAANWVQQLVQFRSLDMGPTAAAAAQPGNTWGEPRRAGFQFNWARYGANSDDALTQGQHTGLAAQAASNNIRHAVIEIGANDFAPTSNAYLNIYLGLWSQSQINGYVNARIAAINTAVTTLENANLGLVICNCPDFGPTPIVRQFYTDASRRNRISAAVAQVNVGILNIARQHRAVHLDINSMTARLLGTNTAVNQFLPIGSVNIQLLNRDTTNHANPLAGFVDDGAHPHTTIQGVFANALMSALNVETRGAAGFVLFSDREILQHAGIAYPPNGTDTLDGVIGAGGYHKYIRNFRCPADIGGQGGIAGPDGFYDNNDFIVFIDRFFARDPIADVGRQGGLEGSDGNFDNNDFIAFISQFFQGCA
ncbi:MAG: GC-type dockerin domain-anchored protein [Phycisphaerales bacterium]